MKLSFFGGAKSVTGANYLIEHEGLNILVECGMFQGLEFVDNINYEDFLYDPKEIDFLFLTHSHTDHIGRVPKLVRDGFKGRIIATDPCIELTKVSWRDSVRIIKEQARREEKEPYFTKEDVDATDRFFEKHDYGDKIDLKGKGTVEIFSAGHILGSAMFRFTLGDNVITFTGDLGNSPAPLIGPPDVAGDTDYLVIESAYGDREHESSEFGAKYLEEITVKAIEKGGVLMIPSFAMERTQILLYYLHKLIEENKIPQIPIFVDSPLANKITKVYKKFDKYFKKDLQWEIQSGEQLFDFPGLKMTGSVRESKAINDVTGPKIIIAGNGMSTAGRILHHEKRYLSDPKSTILFVGYQVEKSLGRRILDKNKTVTIHGEKIQVKCDIHQISAFSAHADNPQLLNFVKQNITNKPKKIFVVQGEENAAWQLAQDLNDMGYEALAPDYRDIFNL